MTKQSAKTKSTINTREELIYALCEAAEIEHGLTCAYLFAAFSMKQFRGEEINIVQQDKIRNWKGKILRVAHQEMEHLGLVCNLLNAIGGPQHFDRPNFPQSKKYYSTEVDLTLSRFSKSTMAAFMAFEKPDISTFDKYKINSDQIVPVPIVIHNGHTVQELYEAILNGFIFLDGKKDELFIGNPESQVEDSEINVGFNNTEYGINIFKIKNLKDAKNAIKEIIEQGEGIILTGDRVSEKHTVLTKLYKQFNIKINELSKVVLSEPDWGKAIKHVCRLTKSIISILQDCRPYIRKEHLSVFIHAEKSVSKCLPPLMKLDGEKYSYANEKKAEHLRTNILDAGINDAEGAILYQVIIEKDCHYLMFWHLYQELKSELEKHGNFEPSRNVAGNPMLNRHADNQNSDKIHIVENKYSRKVLELFNAGYETMVDMLIIFFANDEITQNERILFMNTAFFPFMTMFIRPVGEILTTLPLGEEKKNPLNSLRAGGSFETYINTALMPRTKPRWTYLNEKLKEMVKLSKKLQFPDASVKPYMKHELYKNLVKQMKFLYTNVNRICSNFQSGMNIKS